ncbi:MAG TPA: hypothetical protein VN441_13215, partial [Syntrophomonas sp.]|nr:hypothetical protein [Syntrophomonas sp.]
DILESQFAVDAKAVSDALDGVLKEIPESKLNLFLIRNITKGQVQVVLSRSIKVKDVLMRAENWNKAVRENTPKLTLDLPSGKDSKKNIISAIQGASPITPYPDQVVRLLSRQWTRDGSSPIGTDGKPQKASHEVIGLSFGDVIDFMLRAEGKWEPTARRIINLLIQRITPLLIGVFGAKHCYGPRHLQGLPEPISDYPRDSRQTALQAVAIMGIILDALELRKEKYMKDAAFQVGQVLSLADTLHKDYCIVERKGQMPNSLIGTSLMRRALDSPAGALSDLAERMMEYVRWAKVAGISQDWFKDDSGRNKTIAVNEARKKLRQYQSLADSLASCDLPIECNDVMKAQLLLGFMASQPDDDENKE